MAKTYKIQRLDVIDMLVSIGYKSSIKWDEKKLTDKVNELLDLTSSTSIQLQNQEQQQLLNRIVKALKDGHKFRVIYEDNDSTPAPIKEKVAKKEQKHERQPNPTNTGPGVIETLVRIITDHGPITREDILKRMCKVFPDRRPESMNCTLGSQLSYGLRKRGVLLDRDWGGERVAYFIKQEARKRRQPRPEPTPAKKKTTKKRTSRKATPAPTPTKKKTTKRRRKSKS